MVTTTLDTDFARAVVAQENEALNEDRSFDYVDELYAEDVLVNMTRTGDETPLVSGADIKALYHEWKTAFPDLRVEVEHEAAEGDTVMQYVTMRGTQQRVVPWSRANRQRDRRSQIPYASRPEREDRGDGVRRGNGHVTGPARSGTSS